MPFQLDTSTYAGGIGGGADKQDSLLGTLGSLMDMRSKMEDAQDQQRQRDLEAQQKQQAIDKANRDIKENNDLISKFNEKNGDPSLSDFVNIVGVDRGQKIYEANKKLVNQDEKDLQDDVVKGAQGVAAWPEAGRAQAWSAYEDGLIKKHGLDPSTRMPYSPELLQSVINQSLTPEQFTTAQTNKRKTDIEQQNADREQKLFDINEPGLKAEAHIKARSDTASRMLGAKDAAGYSQIYNTLDPTTQQDFPTPADYVANPKQSTARLQALGMSPAEEQAHKDRMAVLADEDRRFNITENRLNAEGGVTPQMKQAALVRRANARDELQKEISRQAANGTPMAQGDQLSRLIQIDQDYAAEAHQPPNVGLAEDRKQAQLNDLEQERQQRSQPVKQGDKMVPSKNPMSDQEADGRKLGILNSYRAAYGMDPVTKLPPEWTAYRGGADSSKGAAALPADPSIKSQAQTTTAPATAAPRVRGTGTLGALVPNAAAAAPPASSRPLGALVNPTAPAPTAAPAPGGSPYVWSGGDYVNRNDLAAAALQAAANAPPLAARTPAPAAVTSRHGQRSAELASIHAQINAIRASPDRGSAANVAALAKLSARAKQLQGQ
jgi:hypothetical protein